MKKLLLTVGALAIIGMPRYAMAQARLVEKVVQKGNEVVIPYEKYVLPNGLTLIIHEDHSDPIVHVDVTYHVGSAREEINKSGFAHFFEHMMFQGSDNVEDEEHFRIITEAGGTLNGTTNRDRTNYFETVPSNQLEKMLWLEADRMGFLLDAVTQKKFEVQRATVKNERGQRYDNQPYGLVNEVQSKNLYPYGHPYSWLTIGYIEDLNRVNVRDLKNFFLRWYGPNNAVLTIGGDVQPEQVVRLVEKYFGSIPRGAEVQPARIPVPTLSKDRYVSMKDNFAQLPMLRIVYPAPPSYSKDEVALDCLAEIIGRGKGSIFYKNFIKSGKAINASAYNSTSELAGEFTIGIVSYPGQKLKDLEQTVQESFKEFEERGVTDEDILRFTSKAEAKLINSMESVSGKVSLLAAFHTFTGDANFLPKELEAHASVTREDVMRVYNQYIKGKHAVILSVLTNNYTEKAGKDNYVISQKGYKAPSYGYNGLTYVKATDTFDRSKMPEATEPVIVKTPDFWERTFAGNIKAIGTVTNEIPVVTLLLNFKGGKIIDPAGKSGLANIFATMMNEDTKNYSSEDFTAALEQLGSTIHVSADDDEISVHVRSLVKNLDKTLALLEERLLRPQFNEEDFRRNKRQISESIKNALNQPSYVASLAYSSLLLGDDNPLSRPSSGTEASIAQIRLSDIEDYYKNKFSRNDANIVVVGEVAPDEVISKLGFLQQLPDFAVSFPEIPKAPAAPKNKVFFIDIPGAAQTEFRVGYVTDMKYDATGDYYQSSIMNFPLGGAFNSRLNLYLREDRGWTYGARSSFNGNKYGGDYSFSAGIKAAATDSALYDVLHIMEEYKQKGISKEELSFTKKAMSQSEALKYETGFQKAVFLNRLQTYGLPKNYTEQQNNKLKAITVNNINVLAQQKLPSTDNLVILLVGDKATLADKIIGKGFDLVELDREGKILN